MEISRILLAYNSRAAAQSQALPPEVQQAREKEAIKNDSRLEQLLGNEAILEIRKVKGGYIVVTDLHEMQVDVHYLPSEKHFCGPAKFTLLFHQPIPR